MKKSLLTLMGVIATSAIVYGIVNAQSEISELFNEWVPLVEDAYTKLLNDYDNSRWYSSSMSVSCDASNGIHISSPLVEDATMDEVNIYDLFLSPYRMDQLKSWDPAVDTSKIIVKKVEVGEGADSADFNISSDDVNPNTVYYGFISPVDLFDVIGTPSEEICFQLAGDVCSQGTACDTIKNNNGWWDEPQHFSGCVWMDYAEISSTVNGDILTITWTPVDGDTVEIAVFDPEEEVYKSLWAVAMSDQKFEYKMQRDGEQNFRFTNGCWEVKKKFDAKRWEEQPIKATPATGPAENILYIAIAAIVLYGAYVVFFRKADNK